MPMARDWHGITLQQKVHRAAGRAIVGIGMAVSVEAKHRTHVISGTLSRSIHVSPVGEHHSDDESIAAHADMMLSSLQVHPTEGPEGPIVEVGSWLEYACAEWIGRRHPGINEAMESVRGQRVNSIVRQAFFEERL